MVIARIWHGRVPSAKADEYEKFLVGRAVPDYRGTEGNLGVVILRRDEGDVTHFLVITLWRDLESIKRFAGDDYERAKYYPEDREFLLEFEPHARHYKVAFIEFAQQQQPHRSP